MAKTEIEWATDVWNPTTGCDRVSPGCDACYAMTLAKRLKGMGQAKYQRDGDPRTSGPGFGLSLHPDVLEAPARWKKPRMIFVNSMSDLFHPEIPDDYLNRVFDVMETVDRHVYQVLTKRPQRMRAYLDERAATPAEVDAGCELGVVPGRWYDRQPPSHLWLGTSIESDRYVFRADHLRATPAGTRFLSLEPLLGPLPSLDLIGIHWVICGGESGPGARPMDLGWARDIVARCAEARIPCFIKQLGARWEGRHHRDLKGGHIETFPEDLRVREMPGQLQLGRT